MVEITTRIRSLRRKKPRWSPSRRLCRDCIACRPACDSLLRARCQFSATPSLRWSTLACAPSTKLVQEPRSSQLNQSRKLTVTMPTTARPFEQHGDPTSLLVGADLSSALLRIPLEIWLHIFNGEIMIKDLTHLRSISKTFWAVAERLMPHVAARMHPAHANDPRIQDSFFAEALIAAHRLNVRTAADILVSRSDALEVANGERPENDIDGPADAVKELEHRSGLAAENRSAAAMPTRAEWIIGSRRLLHRVQAAGRSWMFGVCASCNMGACGFCHKLKTDLGQYPDRRWAQVTKSHGRYSNAIYGTDVRFCLGCKYLTGELRPPARVSPQAHPDTPFTQWSRRRPSLIILTGMCEGMSWTQSRLNGSKKPPS